MDKENRIELPPEEVKWLKNESKTWPKLTYENLVDYLVKSKAYDGKEMKSFRALYGYNYVQNGWMGDILSYYSDSVCYLKAKISPSQPGVGRSEYNAWIAISDCTVLTGYCTCPAGKGRSCSHISAIIYAVTLAWMHGLVGETCTDKPVAWGKGATQVLTHEQLSEMNFKKPNAFSVPLIAGNLKNTKCEPLPKPKQFLDHKDLKDCVENSCSDELWKTKGTMLYKILNAPVNEVKETQALIHSCHDIESSEPVVSVSCSPCQRVFEKYVAIGQEKRNTLSEQTKHQNNELWKNSRKFRLTSTKINSVPKTARADPNKFLTARIYNRFKGSVATKHGLESEPKARRWYEDMTGVRVEQRGIVLHPVEQYIAASLDGVIDNNTIVEIKCPTRKLNDLIASGKYDVVLQNEKYILNPKGKNGYYTQVQIAMFCSGATLCKFVVWTEESKLIVDVAYDETYVKQVLPRIRGFYFKHLLPRLTDELHYKRMKVSSAYERLCV